MAKRTDPEKIVNHEELENSLGKKGKTIKAILKLLLFLLASAVKIKSLLKSLRRK